MGLPIEIECSFTVRTLLPNNTKIIVCCPTNKTMQAIVAQHLKRSNYWVGYGIEFSWEEATRHALPINGKKKYSTEVYLARIGYGAIKLFTNPDYAQLVLDEAKEEAKNFKIPF